MFKIKRASNRNLVNNDILTETQKNIPEYPTPPLPEKAFRRPPSAKITRLKHATIHPEQAQSNSQKSIELCRQVRSAELRLTERSNIEQQIQHICQSTLRQKCRRLGDMKEVMIIKVLEKSVLMAREELEKDGWRLLIDVIEGEADKMIKSRECKTKYENSMNKIKNMLEDRLNKLTALR